MSRVGTFKKRENTRMFQEVDGSMVNGSMGYFTYDLLINGVFLGVF